MSTICSNTKQDLREIGVKANERCPCEFTDADGQIRRCSRPFGDHLEGPIIAQTGLVTPIVNVRERLRHADFAGGSFVNVLNRPLPFKIPVLRQRLVLDFPNNFEYGEAEYGASVDAWMDSFGGSPTSETTVLAHDMLWMQVLQTICTLKLMLNERDPSSQTRLRTDFSALHHDTLVMKGEAKCDLGQLGRAATELVSKFHRTAYLSFPQNCAEIPGVVTSPQGAQLHRIFHSEGTFRKALVKDYQFHTTIGRAQFIEDIFKIAVWIIHQSAPVDAFHLPPNVRITTRNHHHVTLTSDGLVKEFHRGRNVSAIIANIKTIYDANLPNVEQGVTNCTSITITTIGRTLRDAINRRLVDKQVVLRSVESAIEQLHGIGMAHCDICVDNVFLSLDTGTVFLGDLEYCRPINDAAPSNIRRSDTRARTAMDLDTLQLQIFQDELVVL